MNKARFSQYEYQVLIDESLTSYQVAQLIHLTPGTVRYHRNKLGIRVATYKKYGIVRNLLTQTPHSIVVMKLPIKQVALMYNVSNTAIKEARRVIRQQRHQS